MPVISKMNAKKVFTPGAFSPTSSPSGVAAAPPIMEVETVSSAETNSCPSISAHGEDPMDTEVGPGPVDTPPPPKKKYMTKNMKKAAQKNITDSKRQLYVKACQQFQEGKFSSIFQASKHYGLPYSCLYRYLVNGDEFKGKGRRSEVLTSEEEQKIVDHINYRQRIGSGMTYQQLQLLIQEVLVAVTSSNPERTSPYVDKGHLPNRNFVYRFAKRHNIALRATMEISKGRQILSIDDLVAWQKDTEAGLIDKEEFKDCFKDSSRVFNQDETSIQVGSDNGKVLAEKGTKVLYRVGGSSREHVTASYTVSAGGSCVPVRIFYKGVRNVATQHLKDLPNTGRSGAWQFGVTENGYVTRDSYLDVLKDLDSYLEKNNTKRPVILFIDGPNAHISLQAAAFCTLKKIQPWVLRANMTHLLQPLDLTFFSSLKKKLSQMAHVWHAGPQNAGQTLSKYSVMRILYDATEECLANPTLIPNGFRRAGLFPWDINAPDKTKLEPGSIYSTSSQLPRAAEISPSALPVTISPPQVPDSEESNVFGMVDCDSHHTNPTDRETEASDSEPPPVMVDEDNGIFIPLELESTSTQLALQDTSPPTSMMIEESGSSFPTLMAVQESWSKSAYLEGQDGSRVDDFNSLEVTEFDPIFSSTFEEGKTSSKKPHWYGNTEVCNICKRRILNQFFLSHSQQCSVSPIAEHNEPGVNLDVPTTVEILNAEDQTTKEIKLTTLPVFTLDDRQDHLEKFEVLLLKKIQVKEFEEMFLQKQFQNVKDPLYRAWLNLKFAAVGTETEAVDRLLESKLAKNVPKRKKQRKDFRPIGPARHDPTSTEWVSVLTEQLEKKKQASKRKNPDNALVEQGNKKQKDVPAKKAKMTKKKSTKGKENIDLIL